MPDYKKIYHSQADKYERLVSREDFQGRIRQVLGRVAPLDEADVVELGAGTGRLTRLLAPVVRRIYAFDISGHVLALAVAGLEGKWRNWQVAVADHRYLPVGDGTADVVVSGWSICYLVTDHGARWQTGVAQALAEMKRVLRPGGTAVILETLGTGYEEPHRPQHLKAYYDYLESHGFSHAWIRTDYRFADLAEAEDLIGFFFGEELAQKVVEKRWVIVPECTGIWWLKL